MFRYRTGVAWRDLPGRFGPWQTVWKRHHGFATVGTWDKLLRVIQAEADAAGRVDWNVSAGSSIVRAHQHSATAKRSAREDRTVLVGRPPTRPDRVLADKAYSSHAIRAHLRTRGIGSVIPEPDYQKAHRKRIGSSGGRPVTYDRTAYRGRNVIERAFNGFKHWRGLATRYDKHAIVYRGGLVLAAVLLWLTDLGDTS